MPSRLLSMADIVRESQIPKYRIVYALEKGVLREPQRLNGRRCFTATDLERIVAFFTKGGRQ